MADELQALAGDTQTGTIGFGATAPSTTAPSTTVEGAAGLAGVTDTGAVAGLGGMAPLPTQPAPEPIQAISTATIGGTTGAQQQDLAQQIQEPTPTQIAPVTALDATPTPIPELPQAQLTGTEQEIQRRIQEQMGLSEQLLGESAFRAQQEEALGIPQMMQTQNELASRLQALKNEALQIPLQLQQEAAARGITRGGLAPIQTARLRTNAIAALGVSSLLEASRGNIAMAQQMADRAVSQKFDPIREQLEVQRSNLELIKTSPLASLEDKNRAIRMDAEMANRERAIAAQEADMRAINEFAVQAAQFGADASALQAIQGSKTRGEALQRASQFLGREFAEELKARQFQRSMQEAQYNLSVRKFNEDVRQFDEQMALKNAQIAEAKAQAEIEAAIENDEQEKAQAMAQTMVQNKINLMAGIITSPALDSRVGPTPLTRGKLVTPDVFGAGDKFAGMVHQLVDQEFLDNLISVKAKGATFGALTDKEGEALRNAATQLNDWELKDKNGVGKGVWDIDEQSFREEIMRIQQLALKAHQVATGVDPIGDDDLSEIDFILEGTVEGEFNPANY